MREANEIRKELVNMLKQKESVFQGTVTDVNEEKFTCTVMVEKRVSYYNVRLRSVINPDLNGMALIPKIGSYVLVSRIGKSNELFICLFSEIDKIVFSNNHINFILDNDTIAANVKGTTIDITETGIVIQNEENKINCKLENSSMELNVNENTVEISGSTITFNGGDNGGLVKVNELTNKLNELIESFNDHTHLTGTTSAMLSTTPNPTPFTSIQATVPPPNDSCDKFNPEDYKNKNIKH